MGVLHACGPRECSFGAYRVRICPVSLSGVALKTEKAKKPNTAPHALAASEDVAERQRDARGARLDLS